jgi:hypothetical protein
MAAGVDVPQSLHQRLVALHVTGGCRELRQPLAKGGIQRAALGARDQASSLDQIFVSAEGDISHTEIVYTNFVCIGRFKVVLRICVPAKFSLLQQLALLVDLHSNSVEITG